MPNKLPTKIKPMLGRLAREPFDSPNHVFELKWDGMRALAFIEGGELRLLSRNGRNVTSQFPELAEMPALVKSDSAVLDGEIVCLDDDGKPSFTRLQQILQSKRVTRNRSHPAHFIAFDLLYSGGRSVMKEPLLKRKSHLRDILDPTELIQACEFIEAEGTAFFKATCDLGLKGIMAKEKSSTYLPGIRSPSALLRKNSRQSQRPTDFKTILLVLCSYSYGLGKACPFAERWALVRPVIIEVSSQGAPGPESMASASLAIPSAMVRRASETVGRATPDAGRRVQLSPVSTRNTNQPPQAHCRPGAARLLRPRRYPPEWSQSRRGAGTPA